MNTTTAIPDAIYDTIIDPFTRGEISQAQAIQAINAADATPDERAYAISIIRAISAIDRDHAIVG